MAEAIRSSRSRLWGLRALFVALFMALVMLRMLPLDFEPHSLAGPDLTLALTLSWALRRPDAVPAPLVGILFLLEDMLTMRPPGLYAALAVLTMHRARNRAPGMRERTYLAEWITAGISIVITILGYRLILGLFLLDMPPLSITLSQLATTVLAYPVVTVLSRIFFGLRRAAAGEVDALGHRL